MGSHRQRLVDNLPTRVALLRGEARIDSNDLMTSSCGLILKDVEECTPRGVENALRQMMIFHHIGDLKVFHGYVVILLHIAFRRLEMVISALPLDLQVRLRDVTGSQTAPVTARFAPAHLALFAPECLLRGAIETWIRDGVAFAVSQEGRQPDVDTDIRMRTFRWCMCGVWLRLTDDKRIPMSIGTMHQVHRLGRSFHGAMQLDLEAVSHLLWHHQVFLIFVQIAILPVLPQLDRMPAIGLLKTREANTRDGVLLGSEKALEGLGKPIGKHLYRRSRNMLPLSFEECLKLVFGWNGPLFLILRLDGLQHAIVNEARLSQASHELAGLFLIHEQAVLKCSHERNLLQAMRIVKRGMYACGGGISPP